MVARYHSVLRDWHVATLQPGELYTFSDDPALVVRDAAPEQPREFKPNGLWYAPGGDDNWLEWCLDNDCRRFLRRYLYRLQLDYTDVLRIKTPHELLAFTQQYGYHELGWTFVRQIDWPRVQREFSAIEIIPYQWECRLEPVTHWYYSWDCASGCVWRGAAVRVELVGENAQLEERG